MPTWAATSCRSPRRSPAPWSAIGADDTQFVKAGQPLVRLDQADAKVALDQAEAQLARTVRDVRNLFATSAQLEAAVQLRAVRSRRGAERPRAPRSSSAAPARCRARSCSTPAMRSRARRRASLAAQQQLAATRARVDSTTLEDHPQVRDAAAAVRNAYLQLSRTELPAPVAGFVARRNVQLGQRVGPGTPLMAVVPLDQVWVDANFKEPQLARMRVGQPVTLTRGPVRQRKIVYHGTVAGFGAGTGSAFSLLPAQNATGNWIKIVQRVPVRIALDPREIAAHPLQIGLSMKADVDVSHGGDGARLPQLASNATALVDRCLRLGRRAGRCARARDHRRQPGGRRARRRGSARAEPRPATAGGQRARAGRRPAPALGAEGRARSLPVADQNADRPVTGGAAAGSAGRAAAADRRARWRSARSRCRSRRS